MPIRFRCRFCNQLMGISRRKAGMAVNCPTCHAQVVVPQSEDEAPAPLPAPVLIPPSPPATAAPAPLFERSDFEAFLQDPAPAPRAVEVPAAAPSPFTAETFAPPPPSLPMVPMRSQTAGLLLSPTQATWLTVLAILLLALAFGAGLLVGHYWMG